MKIDALLENRSKAERVEDLRKFIKDEEYNWLESNIGKFSMKQLTFILVSGPADHLRDVARKQILASAAAKPHWSITPTFIVAFIGMILAAVAAWAALVPLFPELLPGGTKKASPAPESGSVPSKE